MSDNGVSETEAVIAEVCNDLRDFLIEKNRKYGNAAISPVSIVSDSDPLETIRVRIDDKLNRLIHQQPDEDEDVMKDLAGYFILYQVALKMQETKDDQEILFDVEKFRKAYEHNHTSWDDIGRLGYNEMTERERDKGILG